MERNLEDILKLVRKEGERDELMRMGRAVHEASQRADHDAQGRVTPLLEQMRERLLWHFRAMRYPVPSIEELDDLVRRHFGST